MRVEFKPSFLIAFAVLTASVAVTYGLERGLLAGAILTASLYLHEAAHAVMSLRRGVRVTAIGLSAMGGYTIRARSADWVTEAQSAISGPLVNLLLAWMFMRMGGGYWQWLGSANLVLGVSNLIPFPGSDGGRLWNALLAPIISSRPRKSTSFPNT
jgi:Zn-dependent protease